MAPWWLPALGFVSAEGLQVNGLSCSQAEQERGGACSYFLWLWRTWAWVPHLPKGRCSLGAT